MLAGDSSEGLSGGDSDVGIGLTGLDADTDGILGVACHVSHIADSLEGRQSFSLLLLAVLTALARLLYSARHLLLDLLYGLVVHCVMRVLCDVLVHQGSCSIVKTTSILCFNILMFYLQMPFLINRNNKVFMNRNTDEVYSNLI